MSATSPIIGHINQLSQLESDLKSGNLAHAYLFVGPEHIGKFTVAKWFAAQILKKDLSPQQLLLDPDVFIMDALWMEEKMEDMEEIATRSNVPQQHRIKAKIKTDVITIEDVRSLQERLHETGNNTHRVCLIRSVERMRDEAANAFLKMLEEPPPGRIFLLTASSLDNVLPTIRSRCRVLHFSPVGNQELKKLLSDLSDDEARFILHVAQGAVGSALGLKSDPDQLRMKKQVHTQARDVWVSNSLGKRLSLLAPLEERGAEADEFLLHLALTLRELPGRSRVQEKAFAQLVEDFQTNAHRELIVERFAMNI